MVEMGGVEPPRSLSRRDLLRNLIRSASLRSKNASHFADVEFNPSCCDQKDSPAACGAAFLVEMGGVEPPSESASSGPSPGADDYLHSLSGPRIVTLNGSVAS